MKIGIVGTGMVGSTAAYALVMRGFGSEIVLVDKDKKRASAEANDILHAVPFAHPLDIFSGDYADLKGCRVVIVAAGVSQKSGETRLELLQRNADVFRQVIPEVLTVAKDAVIVVATNPVDIMTHMASHFASQMGVPKSRVLGSGTTLDTARFRSLLGRHLDVDSQHVHAYVVGEHGDSEVVSWSSATIAGMSLEEFCEVRKLSLTQEHRDSIDENVRRAAYHIIEGKGATYYGIGSALARIVHAILNNQRAILTVCGRVDAVGDVKDVTIAMPHLIDGEGLVDSIPIALSNAEQSALQASAAVIREAIDSINL
ncbi:L-lactate dehydrogenase [Planctomycetes bacterium CA13]|uniref:L-lactate dehydrogenase n=1 Tax=Novipirellula herctigrandis TaxID=2527986 RepID=A0A5C5YNP0_9BACT|nr:L-lactate dehydrogenase [Planctomycetes bacterium CA13]